MKKNILLVAFLALLPIAFYACSNNRASTTGPATTASLSAATHPTAANDSVPVKKTAILYTCPMHPEIISNKPGKCPKCGMDLVKKESPAKDSTMKKN
jgi:hypothetical protein